MKLYGIPNCDSVKKARKLLNELGADYQFHDFRKDGIELEQLQSWQQAVAFNTLINKRSTSWRQLSDEQKQDLEQNQNLTILLENPTLIKRPVIEYKDKIIVGFNAETLKSLL